MDTQQKLNKFLDHQEKQRKAGNIVGGFILVVFVAPIVFGALFAIIAIASA